MRYIVHQEESIVDAYEAGEDFNLQYPPYTTTAVNVSDGMWTDLLTNPAHYSYKDGVVITNST